MRKLTMTEKRRAVRNVINTLRTQPERYVFMKSEIPTKSNPEGCILGLLGEELGLRNRPVRKDLYGYASNRSRLNEIASAVFGVDNQGDFYAEMTGAHWQTHGKSAARSLERYATKQFGRL